MAESNHEGGVRLHFSYHSTIGNSDSVSGPVDHEDEYRNAYSSGDSSGQISELYSNQFTLDGESSTTLNLQYMVDGLDVAKGFSKINTYEFRNRTRGSVIYIRHAATNPWTALFDDDSDVEGDSLPQLKVSYGAIMGDHPAGLTVSDTSRSLTLENPGTDPVTFDIRLAGVYGLND